MIYGGPLCGRGPAEWRRVRARLCMFCGCVCNWSQKLRLRLSASTKAIQSKLNWTEPRWRGGALCNWNSKSFLVWQFCKRNCRCLALVIVFCAVIRRNVARFFFFFFFWNVAGNGSQLAKRGPAFCMMRVFQFYFLFQFSSASFFLAWQGWHLALGIPVSVAVFFVSFKGSFFFSLAFDARQIHIYLYFAILHWPCPSLKLKPQLFISKLWPKVLRTSFERFLTKW